MDHGPVKSIFQIPLVPIHILRLKWKGPMLPVLSWGLEKMPLSPLQLSRSQDGGQESKGAGLQTTSYWSMLGKYRNWSV